MNRPADNYTLPAWPYPRWIAHRGAGKLAPENTLAAFRVGAQHGYRMFECDAKLSSDGVPFLMHDATLARTTNAAELWGEQPPTLPNPLAPATDDCETPYGPNGGDHPWSALAQLDAGGWYSRHYAGETLPTLQAVVRYCLANRFHLNIEIKPTPGTEATTGRIVAQQAAHWWNQGIARYGPAPLPLLSSFQPDSLGGAKIAAPHVPRALLLDTLWDGYMDMAMQLGCVALVCNHALWNADLVAQVHQAGMRALSYTVNDEWAAKRLLDLNTDGIITDRIDLFPPAD